MMPMTVMQNGISLRVQRSAIVEVVGSRQIAVAAVSGTMYESTRLM